MGVERGSAGILMVDPDTRCRAEMSSLLGDAGHDTSEVASGEEALEAASRKRPGLVILEVCLPGICGYEICRWLRDRYAQSVSIILVSGTRTESFDRVAGILVGADDYLCKPVAADGFLARVGRLLPAAAAPGPHLTLREHEVLSLLGEGLGQREIAERLCISDKTAGTHTEHIFAKLGVHSRAQAVAHAYRHRLVGPTA